MRLLPYVSIIALILFAAALSSCGSDDSSGSQTDSIAGEWRLRDAVIDGADFRPVDGYPITIEFENDRISGSGGCNTYGGGLAIDGDGLSLSDIFMTERACADFEPMEAESTFAFALGGLETFERTDDLLILSGPDTTMTFTPIAPTPDAPLTNTAWTLDTLISGQAASSTFFDVAPAVLSIEDGGTIGGSTGCRDFDGTYALDGDQLRLSYQLSGEPCEGSAAQQEAAITAAFDQPLTVAIIENRLTLTAPDETGLSYRTGG